MSLRTLILWMACLLLFSSCGSQSDHDLPGHAGPRTSAADLQAGRELFLTHCARCHGTVQEKRRQGSDRFRSTAPDFTESRYRRGDPSALFQKIRRGGMGMPAWSPHLSEAQTWQIVSYLLSRSTTP